MSNSQLDAVWKRTIVMQCSNGLAPSAPVTSHDILSAAARPGGISASCAADICALLPWQILLVDDDASIRQVTYLALRHFGQEVDIASSVPEALAQLAQKTYNLVITDYNMPGGNGSELIKAMKVNGLQARSMIITGQDTEALYMTLSIEETPDLILGKPFRADALRGAIRSIQPKNGGQLPPVSNVA